MGHWAKKKLREVEAQLAECKKALTITENKRAAAITALWDVKEILGLDRPLGGCVANAMAFLDNTIDRLGRGEGEDAWALLDIIREDLESLGCCCEVNSGVHTAPMFYSEWIVCCIKKRLQGVPELVKAAKHVLQENQRLMEVKAIRKLRGAEELEKIIDNFIPKEGSAGNDSN